MSHQLDQLRFTIVNDCERRGYICIENGRAIFMHMLKFVQGVVNTITLLWMDENTKYNYNMVNTIKTLSLLNWPKSK